jgi:hypothetical protein
MLPHESLGLGIDFMIGEDGLSGRNMMLASILS